MLYDKLYVTILTGIQGKVIISEKGSTEAEAEKLTQGFTAPLFYNPEKKNPWNPEKIQKNQTEKPGVTLGDKKYVKHQKKA